MHCNYNILFGCAEWSEEEVVEKYLKPTGFEYLAKIFVEQHITGAVLLVLTVSESSTSCLVVSSPSLHGMPCSIGGASGGDEGAVSW